MAKDKKRPDLKSDFDGKAPPVPPDGVPKKLPRIYPWRGWTIVEWETKTHPGGVGHLLFRRKERAEAFLERTKAGDSKTAFNLALGRMRPDWKAPAQTDGVKEEEA